MKNKKLFWIGFVSYILCFLCFFLLLSYSMLRINEHQFYQRMAAIISEVPEPSKIISALKEPSKETISLGIPVLESYGYYGRLLNRQEQSVLLIFAEISGCFLLAFCICLLLFQHKLTAQRIESLTNYLKQIHAGNYPLHPYEIEDTFSLLEDEIYKTVIALRESRNEAMAAKENLAKNMADISHQLKTPLTSLSLLSELLKQRIKKPEEQQIVEQILTQTEHLSTLTVALLTLSRMDAGVFQLEQKEIAVEELISCAAEPVLPLIKEKEQTFSLHGNLDCVLLCDLGWTAEGIGNILKNCYEYAPRGSQILVSVNQNPIFTEIIVEDTGNGFEEEELNLIFERFHKGKHSAKGSIGIGLSLTKSIVERQNGEIFAENRKEGGARFRIKFYKI